MQYFKGDDTEKKFHDAANGLIGLLSDDKDDFYTNAFAAATLGALIYDNDLAPLSKAISREIFIDALKEIIDAFVEAGTFESYITVFKKIFGDDVTITFTVPSAGKLEIDIEASGVELSDALVREIVDNDYVYHELVDYTPDNIALQTIKGFQSQYELEQMLFEMVPGGIYTVISLTLGV